MKTRLRLADAPDVLTVVEAARILGVGRNGCYELVRRGVLPSVKLSRRIRILKAELLRTLAEGTHKEAASVASPAARGGGRRERPTPE